MFFSNIDKRKHEKRETWDYALLKPSEKTIQAISLFASFADNTFISGRYIFVAWTQKTTLEMLPLKRCLRKMCMVEALDGTVAAAFFRPA